MIEEQMRPTEPDTDSIAAYCSMLYDAGDLVCSGNQYANAAIEQSKALGPLITLNPIVGRRRIENVTKHRNFLMELDHKDMDRAAQLEYLTSVGVPYSVLTWSGSKSVHAIVSLVTPVDSKTWTLWARAALRVVSKADQQTKDPARFTRLAGAIREHNGAPQELIALGQRVANDKFRGWISVAMAMIQKEDAAKVYMRAKIDTDKATGYDALGDLTQAFIRNEHPCTNGRNNALFISACDMFNCDYSLQQVIDLLTEPSLSMGLSSREISGTIKNAYNKVKESL